MFRVCYNILLMIVFEFLKSLYNQKSAVSRHLTLFAICGILGLSFFNLFSTFGNYFNFPIVLVPLKSNLEIWFNIILSVIILGYLMGYEYKILHSFLNTDKVELMEFDSKSINIFFKILPVFLLWQTYFWLFSFLGGYFTLKTQNSLYFYVFSVIMLFITPFVMVVYLSFAKDFKYSPEIISPLTLFKCIDKTIIDIVLLCVCFGLITILPVGFLIGYFDWVFSLISKNAQLIGLIFGFCLSNYLFVIFKLVFCLGIAKITKEKF